MNMTGKTIVVVEDEPYIRHIISRKLQGAGYAVHTACDGAEGLDLVRDLQPSLLITDLKMPYMDGLEVCAACRQDPRTQRIPIIMVTGSVITTAQIQPKIKALGNTMCISKPFSPRQLLRKVQELVEPGAPEAS
jgi:CheY-like chemotaxis protein